MSRRLNGWIETVCWGCEKPFKYRRTDKRADSFTKHLHFVAGDAWVYLCVVCAQNHLKGLYSSRGETFAEKIRGHAFKIMGRGSYGSGL
jgi:hypothetical protein